MKVTRNLKVFAVLCIVWSVIFFSILHWALFAAEQRWPVIVTAAVLYGTGFALMGYLSGRSDPASKTRMNLGLAYYFTSNLASLLVGGLWVITYRPDEIRTLVIMTVVFVLLSVIALLSSNQTIKGIEKDKLFQ